MTLAHTVHSLGHMDQIDRGAAENILREMAAADIDLDQLSQAVAISKRALLRKLAEGSFKIRDLGRIAAVLDCSPAALIPEGKEEVA